MTNDTDLVIIGSGPAAWTSAIYAARTKRTPTVLTGETPGGQLMFTTEIENFPGFPNGILGPTLMDEMRKQSERFGVKVIDKNATSIQKDGDKFKIFYGGGTNGSDGLPDVALAEADERANFVPSIPYISTRAVIIATGATANTLKLPGEDRLMGRGVGTCAVCDAPFYKDREIVFVIGGGDSAMEEARALAKFAKRVVILVRSEKLRASQIMIERIKMINNIEIWYNSETQEFLGEKVLERIKVVKSTEKLEIPANGVFYAIGHTPATSFLADSGVLMDKHGYIKTNLNFGSGSLALATHKPSTTFFPTATSVPGIFAAGDCVDPLYRQAVTAAGMGCMAALDVEKWLSLL